MYFMTHKDVIRMVRRHTMYMEILKHLQEDK
jgi:hypothetical protein